MAFGRQQGLSEQQERPLRVEGASVALSAGAGCGKTTVLTARFLGDLEGDAPRPLGSIVALTFTEKAARELRQRIRKQCRDKLARGDDPARWRAVLRGLEAARIGTFHEYCGQWLRQHAVEAGIDPDFVILDQSIAGAIRDAALGKILRQWLSDKDPDLIELAVEFGLARVRDALADLLAERASGRLAEWERRTPEEIVAIWRDVWYGEARARLFRKVERAAIACVDLLEKHEIAHPKMTERRAYLLEILPELPRNLDRTEQLLAVKEQAKVHGVAKQYWPSEEIYKEVQTAFETLREAIKGYGNASQWDEQATHEAAEHGLRLARLALRARRAYEAAKHARGGLDFDDLLTRTRDLLAGSSDAEARSIDAGADIERLLVDEFQDTDPVQSEILERLAGAEVGTGRLFLVGDFKQSIYRFRGAQPEIFQNFRARFPDAGRHALTENFRSVPTILDFVNALFAEVFPDPETALGAKVASLAQADQPGVEFLWASETEPMPASTSKPTTRDRRRLEARWLARRLRQRLEAGWMIRDRASGRLREAHPGDVAFLFRAMTDVAPYENALAEEGFDYHTVGGAAFYLQQEVHDLINTLSAVEDPLDVVALSGSLRSPFFCLSDDGLFWLTTARGSLVEGLDRASEISELSTLDRQRASRARDLLERWRRDKDRIPIAALVNRVLDESGYEAALLGESLGPRKRANARKLVRLARRFDLQGGFTLAAFVARLRADLRRPPREEQAATTDEEGTSVRLMSIHQAKGLEFPIVLLPDLNRKPPGRRESVAFHPVLGPLVRPSRDPAQEASSESEEDLESVTRRSLGWLVYQSLEQQEDEQEALRLFYVATTRARDALIVSAPLGPTERAISPAMALLDERFDRQTGLCRAELPEGWMTPRIHVTLEAPPAQEAPAPRAEWRLPLIETAEQIEHAQRDAEPPRDASDIVAQGQTPAGTCRGRYLDLDPAFGLAPTAARLDRLTRVVLADALLFQVKDWPSHAAQVLRRHDGLTAQRWIDEVVRRLEPWINGRLGRALAAAPLLERARPWLLSRSCGGPEAVVFRGRADLLYRGTDGAGRLVLFSDASASAERERLRLFLSARAAENSEVGPISQGWRIRLGKGGGLEGVDSFEDRDLDEAIAAVIDRPT